MLYTSPNFAIIIMQEKNLNKFARYKPLAVIVGTVIIAAWAVGYHSPIPFLHLFMGLFFLIFAMFKFFDLEGFVEGFLMYDLVAKRFRTYAYIYPFIEVLLGILYLSDGLPIITDLITIVVMFAGAAGIVNSIGKGEDLSCACLGTTLNVPLSLVSVVENLGMGLMAILSLTL